MLPLKPPFYASRADSGGTGSFTIGDRINKHVDLKRVIYVDDADNPADKTIPYVIIDGDNIEWGADAVVTVAGQFTSRTPTGTVVAGVEGLDSPSPLDISQGAFVYWYDVENAFDWAAAVAIAQSDRDAITALRADVDASAENVAIKEAQAVTDAGTIATLAANVPAAVANNWGNISKLIADDPDYVAHCFSKNPDPSWLDRGQGTSWHSTLGKPPRFCAHVLFLGKLKTIDLTQTNTPTWHEVSATAPSSERAFWSSISDASSITAINGRVYIGLDQVSVTSGLLYIDYLADKFGRIGTTATRGGEFHGIADINNNVLLSGVVKPIVNSVVNAVTATILPNAPRDEYGMLVPTIAVATDGGPNLLQPNIDGGYDIFNITGVGACTHVWFGGDTLYIGRGINSHTTYFKRDISAVSADFSVASSNYNQTDAPALLPYEAPGSSGGVVAGENELLLGLGNGLVRIKEDVDTPANGAVSYTTTSYATPMMKNPIACLMNSTTAGTVGSGELVANGVDPTASTGWTAQNGTITVVANNFRLTTNGGVASAAYAITTVAGKFHQVELEFAADGFTGNAFLYAGTSAGGGQLGSKIIGSTLGVHRLGFVATGTTTYISFACSSTTLAAETADFNNVSCGEAIPDHSGNGNHLQVVGTLTATPVATGAELVAYSGFTADNYGRRPYPLAFGTGDFHIVGYVSGDDTDRFILEINDVDDAGTGFYLYQNGAGELTFYKRSTGAPVPLLGSALNAGFQRYAFFREGGVLKMYLGNVMVASVADTTDYTNAAAELRIGRSTRATALAGDFSQTLVEFGTGALSAAQIASDYAGTRDWFAEAAKITLQGSSNQVNCSAYDPVTNTDLIGTNDYVTIFDHTNRTVVKRIDASNSNLTGGIITSITAYNGTYAIGNSLGEVYYYEPAVGIRENRWFGGFWPKLRAFMARLSITETLFKIFYVNVEIEKDLTLGGDLVIKEYTTLPSASTRAENTVIYYNDGGTRKLLIQRGGDWRTHTTEGAIVS